MVACLAVAGSNRGLAGIRTGLELREDGPEEASAGERGETKRADRAGCAFEDDIRREQYVALGAGVVDLHAFAFQNPSAGTKIRDQTYVNNIIMAYAEGGKLAEARNS